VISPDLLSMAREVDYRKRGKEGGKRRREGRKGREGKVAHLQRFSKVGDYVA